VISPAPAAAAAPAVVLVVLVSQCRRYRMQK